MSDAVPVTAPAKSSRCAAVARGAPEITTSVRTTTRTPTGTLTRKIQCQSRASVRMPPRRTPSEPPPEATKPKMPIAFARSVGSVKSVIISERATAETTAPPTPCTARAEISIACEFAKPHTADATVNRATPAMNSLRCPKRSPSLPPRSRKPPKVIRYALTTHASDSSENPRSARIDGSATPTIVTSRTIIRSPRQRMRSASQRRSISVRPSACGLVREHGHAGLGAPAVGELQVGLAAVAEEALALPQRHREDHQPVLVDQPVRVERADDVAAAVDQDVLPGLLLQRRYLFREISLEQRPVPGQGLCQAPRRDVLGQRVHADGEVAFALLHRWPRGREALEGHAPEQERVAREELIGLVLGQLVVEVGVRPAAVLDLSDPAGIGDDPVESHVLRRYDLPHPGLRSCAWFSSKRWLRPLPAQRIRRGTKNTRRGYGPRMALDEGAPSVGALLRVWRERRNVTQREVASSSAVSRRYLSFIETGRAPSREMVLTSRSASTCPCVNVTACFWRPG